MLASTGVVLKLYAPTLLSFVILLMMKQSVNLSLCLAILFLLVNSQTAFRAFPSNIDNKYERFRCDSTITDEDPTLNSVIEILVKQRTQYRRERKYAAADNIKDILNTQYKVEVIDFPFKPDGSVVWKFIEPQFPDSSQSSSESANGTEYKRNLMWLARNSYDLLTTNSLSEESIINSAIRQLKVIEFSRTKEMQGRKFADAAFEFSLAGVGSTDLYKMLLFGASSEMERYGYRKSCRPIDILQVVERLAVSGILDQDIYNLGAKILRHKECNAPLDRPLSYGAAISKLSSGNFSLFSDMPLLWLWRFAARQRKHGNQAVESISLVEKNILGISDTSHILKFPIFDDPTLPLVVDIGCGYGVSILGLSYRESQMRKDDTRASKDFFQNHNYLACDMSHRAVSYATGLSERWGMQGYCQFIELDAENFLDLILREYAGSIECILINFPTPYQFGVDQSADRNNDNNNLVDLGNAQLPREMCDFMVTEGVIKLCEKLLAKKCSKSAPFEKANSVDNLTKSINDNVNATMKFDRKPMKYLIIQTNVEDVAVHLKSIVTQSVLYNSGKGFKIPIDSRDIVDIKKSWEWNDHSNEKLELEFLEATESSSSSKETGLDVGTVNIGFNADDNNDDVHDNEVESLVLQKRATKWISAGGERATGHGWLASSPLPRFARTETEAMCAHNKKPVHRILFVFEG